MAVVVRPDVVRVWLLMGVKVARLVGDGVAVVVRPDAVRGVVAHGVKLLRSGRGCGGRCGVSARGIEVAKIVSEVRPAYQGIKYDIYNMLGYYQTKTTLNLKIMRKYLAVLDFILIFAAHKTTTRISNNNKIQDYENRSLYLQSRRQPCRSS